jgi:MFS superfamily sulfate permease-like transporter
MKQEQKRSELGRVTRTLTNPEDFLKEAVFHPGLPLTSFSSQCVWVVSFLSSFFLSLPYGVAVGVAFSILVVIFQTQL